MKYARKQAVEFYGGLYVPPDLVNALDALVRRVLEDAAKEADAFRAEDPSDKDLDVTCEELAGRIRLLADREVPEGQPKGGGR